MTIAKTIESFCAAINEYAGDSIHCSVDRGLSEYRVVLNSSITGSRHELVKISRAFQSEHQPIKKAGVDFPVNLFGPGIDKICRKENTFRRELHKILKSGHVRDIIDFTGKPYR